MVGAGPVGGGGGGAGARRRWNSLFHFHGEFC